MKRLKMMLAAMAALCMISVPAFATTGLVMAEDLNLDQKVCSGVEFEAAGGTQCQEGEGEGLADIIMTVINIFSWIVGVVSVIMIIYGGFKYITSAGNDANVTSAKNTILYAIIGLVVVALAQVIVRFVMTSLNSD